MSDETWTTTVTDKNGNKIVDTWRESPKPKKDTTDNNTKK